MNMRNLLTSPRPQIFVAGIFVAFIVLIAGTLALTYRHGGSPNPLVFKTDYWRANIQSVGAARAYEELARDVARLDPSDQHGAAHAFGGALYMEEGIGGFTTCDIRFSYGCFHEFIGRSIIDRGIDVVGTLDRLCGGDTAGCQHGIGHGVLAYLGYGTKDLTQAIRICASLTDDNALQGCDAGVYMEYNLQTMTQGGSATTAVRMPDSGGMYAPCDTLAHVAQRVCYQWQPQWWWVYFTEALHSDHAAALSRTAALCEKVADRGSREACVAGTGLMAPVAGNYDPHRSAALCDASFGDVNEQLICKGYAANVYNSTQSSAVALRVCDGLIGERSLYCRSYAEGTANIANPRALPTL